MKKYCVHAGDKCCFGCNQTEDEFSDCPDAEFAEDPDFDVPF